MTSEPLRPGQLATRQRRALARYVRYEVHPYSTFHRDRLDRAGLGASGVREVADLARLPPLEPDGVDPAAFVLRPTEDRVLAAGEPSLRWHVLWAKLTGRQDVLNVRLLDPAYKPIHWTLDGGLPVGWTADDLDRLADLGRRWLELAGLRRSDVLVSSVPPGPHLAYWQLVLGCRRAGLAAIHLPEPPLPHDLAAMAPTVLAGDVAGLLRVFRSARRARVPLDGLRAVIVAGDLPSERDRQALWSAAPDTATVECAWAPPGVRSLWVECRGGDGLHTWPDAEVVEVDTSGDGAGEVLWTSLGWRGTVLLRLRTGVHGTIEPGPCPACGSVSPRLLLR